MGSESRMRNRSFLLSKSRSCFESPTRDRKLPLPLPKLQLISTLPNPYLSPRFSLANRLAVRDSSARAIPLATFRSRFIRCNDWSGGRWQRRTLSHLVLRVQLQSLAVTLIDWQTRRPSSTSSIRRLERLLHQPQTANAKSTPVPARIRRWSPTRNDG